jgi:hypothetical protein
MNTRAFLAAAAALALALSTATAWASGNDGGGGAETGDAAAYNAGKSVFANKLACSSCPLAGKKLDATLVRELLASKPTGVNLSQTEANSLDTYLKRRFKL